MRWIGVCLRRLATTTPWGRVPDNTSLSTLYGLAPDQIVCLGKAIMGGAVVTSCKKTCRSRRDALVIPFPFYVI